MADGPLTELRIPAGDYQRLHAHLFPGDHDEHGAILLAGEHHTDTRTTLAVRETHLLDPHEFPPGTHGYRQFAPGALARLGNRAAQERLALVTVHSHPGAGERNSLSRDDLAAHERVFPHLLDITDASSVTGAGLIDPILLQREAATPEQRAQQNYLGQENIADPSVTTLNAAAAAGALNVLLMSVIGQADEHLSEHRITLTREGRILMTTPERDPDCRWCGEGERSHYARADTSLLPLRPTKPVSVKSSFARRLISALARR